MAAKLTSWYIVVAVLFIIAGAFAIIEPAVAGLGITLLVGWALLFGGISHLIGAFKGGGAKRVIFQVLLGIVYLIVALYCLAHPLLAVGSLTLVLAAVIFVEGVLEIMAYFQVKSESASGWMLFNGIITLLLGVMIWRHWPSSSIWAIGILVGVNLLMTGTSRLMLGLALRRLGRSAAA